MGSGKLVARAADRGRTGASRWSTLAAGCIRRSDYCGGPHRGRDLVCGRSAYRRRGRSPQAIEISEPLNDIEAARVTLAPAVGQVNVGALEDSGNFVEGTIRYRRNERITQDFADGTNARLVVKTQGTYNFVAAGPGLKYAWDLRFNPDTELDLDTDMGIGDANLDLSELAIDDVKVDFGIGEVTIELPTTGEFDIDIDGGIGAIVIKVPEGMALRVRTDTGIVGRNIPSDYSRNDNIYTSPGYSDAENRANLTLGLGIGSVSIREIDK